MLPPPPAERVDTGVSDLLAGRLPLVVGPDRAARAEVARLVQAALPPIPAGLVFEERLAERLRGGGLVDRLRRQAAAVGQQAVAARRQLTPTRVITAGAVSSAAVGVTALAVWAGGRRSAGRAGGHR
jgi:hypothetical protein